MAPQDGSVRFAALAEKSADVAVKRLDTHFIDQLGEPRIFDATFRVWGRRMRLNPKPAVGDMRKRITRRCVSAATGACC
jgi:hypothetical protein